MTVNLTDHDWEILSAFIDGRLSSPEKSHLELRLQGDTEFAAAYRSLVRTRAILKEIPRVRRRRSYMLSHEMVRKVGWLRLIPTLNFSSAATALLAVLLFIMDIIPSVALMNHTSAPLAAAPAMQDSAARPAAEAKVPEELGLNLTSTLETIQSKEQAGELTQNQASPQETQSPGTEMLILPSPENAVMAPAPPAPENPQAFAQSPQPEHGPVGLTAPSMKVAPAESIPGPSDEQGNQYSQEMIPTLSGTNDTAAQPDAVQLDTEAIPATEPEITSSIEPTSLVEENRIIPSPDMKVIPVTQIPTDRIEPGNTEVPLKEKVAGNNVPSAGGAIPTGSPTRIPNTPGENVEPLPISRVESLVKVSWITLLAISAILALLSAILKKKSLP